MDLFIPDSYRKAKPHERARYCNGCGGAGSLTSWMVPNSIWGICIAPACNIHDWAYAHSTGKARADLMLLCNLLILCSCGSKWLYPLRALRCLTYYLAVTIWGRKFYGRKIAETVRRRKRG